MSAVAFICHPYHRGGVTRWTIDAAKEYLERGKTVYFITVDPKSKFVSAGNCNKIISLLPRHNNFKLITADVGYEFEFGTAQYRTYVYSKLLAQYVPLNTPVILADDATIWDVSSVFASAYKFIGVLHGDDTVYYKWGRKYYDHVSGLVCVSERIKETLVNNYLPPNADRQKIAIRSCGILLPVFKDVGNNDNKIHIGFVGRLSEEKCPDDLLKIAALMAKQEIPFHMHIIGDGTPREPLQLKAIEDGIDDKVSFYGWLEQADIYKQLSGYDIVLLTSKFEGMPISMMEGLACGCAMVSTRVSGVEDFEHAEIANDCIFLYPLHDIEMAVDKIKLAAQLDRTKRQSATRHMAEQEFSMTACLDKYDAFINTITKHGATSAVVPKLSVNDLLYSRLLAIFRSAKLKITK